MAHGDMILHRMIIPIDVPPTSCEADRYLAYRGARDTVVQWEELDCSSSLTQLKNVFGVQQMWSLHVQLLASLENGRPEGCRDGIRLNDGLRNEETW